MEIKTSRPAGTKAAPGQGRIIRRRFLSGLGLAGGLAIGLGVEICGIGDGAVENCGIGGGCITGAVGACGTLAAGAGCW